MIVMETDEVSVPFKGTLARKNTHVFFWSDSVENIK